MTDRPRYTPSGSMLRRDNLDAFFQEAQRLAQHVEQTQQQPGTAYLGLSDHFACSPLAFKLFQRTLVDQRQIQDALSTEKAARDIDNEQARKELLRRKRQTKNRPESAQEKIAHQNAKLAEDIIIPMSQLGEWFGYGYIQKAELYDDVVNGTDIILVLNDQKSGEAFPIGIDITTAGERKIEKKFNDMQAIMKRDRSFSKVKYTEKGKLASELGVPHIILSLRGEAMGEFKDEAIKLFSFQTPEDLATRIARESFIPLLILDTILRQLRQQKTIVEDFQRRRRLSHKRAEKMQAYIDRLIDLIENVWQENTANPEMNWPTLKDFREDENTVNPSSLEDLI